MRNCLTCKAWSRLKEDLYIGLCTTPPERIDDLQPHEWRFQFEVCDGWEEGDDREPIVENVFQFDKERLYNARLMRGLYQQELADLLGVKKDAVSKWEMGAHCPTFRHMVKITEFLEGKI